MTVGLWDVVAPSVRTNQKTGCEKGLIYMQDFCAAIGGKAALHLCVGRTILQWLPSTFLFKFFINFPLKPTWFGTRNTCSYKLYIC